MPDEPAEGDAHIKVPFRMPTGPRVVRRFSPTATVQQMFDMVSATTKKPVRLINLSTQFPKRALRDIEGGLSAFMKDAQVAGNMILVQIKTA